jgi:hypothetical protein
VRAHARPQPVGAADERGRPVGRGELNVADPDRDAGLGECLLDGAEARAGVAIETPLRAPDAVATNADDGP